MSKKTQTNFATNSQRSINAGFRKKRWHHLLKGIKKSFQTQISWQTVAQTMAELNNQNHRTMSHRWKRALGGQAYWEMTACPATRPLQRAIQSYTFLRTEVTGCCPAVNHQTESSMIQASDRLFSEDSKIQSHCLNGLCTITWQVKESKWGSTWWHHPIL
jgi:hypothetical protein